MRCLGMCLAVFTEQILDIDLGGFKDLVVACYIITRSYLNFRTNSINRS